MNKIVILILMIPIFATAEVDLYDTPICPSETQRAVEQYCSGRNCAPLFDQDFRAIKPGYVEEIKQAVPEILMASKKLDVPTEYIVAALLTVQVKGGYRTMSGEIKTQSTAGSGQARVVPSPISGADPKAVPTPGSGQARIVPNPMSGEDTKAVPTPGSGQEPVEKASARCNWRSGYNNLARLDHSGPYQAEEYLSDFEGRKMMSCEQVHQAINYGGKDILYLAAMLKRNEEIFSSYGLEDTYTLAVAVTLYGFADVEKTAKKVASRASRTAQPNSWGLYAQCQEPLVAEILGAVVPSKK